LRKQLGFLKLAGTAGVVIFCLTVVPAVIRNNRVVYIEGNPPEVYERMLKYRRTTISELREFERLFPSYLCEFDYGKRKLVINPTGTSRNAANLDPNSPVKWRLSAGLHRRYLFVMEIDIVFAKVDPETGKIFSSGSHKEPTFALWEARWVSAPLVLFRKRRARTSLEKIRTFAAGEWRRLVEAEGDFSVLGVELKDDDPVRNFELAFRNNH
jgi:hypothetical protein